LTDATADIAVGLIIAAARRFYEAENLIRSQKFEGFKPKLLLGIEMKGKTAGIIGAGRIGFATAKRLKAFGTKIIYFSRRKNRQFEDEHQAKRVSLNSLLELSDFISIHLSLSKETFHILNEKNLPKMKRTAVIVNTSRGEVIDEKVLRKLLKQKKIFSAGLDVFENEPNVNPEFFKLDNVFMLPHIGSATLEARSSMAELCAKNVINVLNNLPPITPVNF
jgi:glyoxylate reductase